MKLLASLRLTVWVLLALALWLALGALALGLDPRSAAFRALDAARMQDWLTAQAGAYPWLSAWLLGLLLLAGLLMLNLALCSLTKLASGPRAGRGRRLLVLAVHLLALAAVSLQGASFFTGAKQTRLRLAPGQSLALGSEASLRLAGVDFPSDPALLKLKGRAARRAQSRAGFDRKRNLARVELVRQGRAVQSGTLGYFSPVELGGWRVFLVGFYLAGKGERPQVGVMLNLVQSPLWPWFVLSYGGLVGGLLWLCLLELARARRRNGRSSPG